MAKETYSYGKRGLLVVDNLFFEIEIGHIPVGTMNRSLLTYE